MDSRIHRERLVWLQLGIEAVLVPMLGVHVERWDVVLAVRSVVQGRVERRRWVVEGDAVLRSVSLTKTRIHRGIHEGWSNERRRQRRRP